MYAPPPKKMLIINILDILKKYTDENHRLSQKDIIEILDKEYCMKIDRKSVKRNLMNLIEFYFVMSSVFACLLMTVAHSLTRLNTLKTARKWKPKYCPIFISTDPLRTASCDF